MATPNNPRTKNIHILWILNPFFPYMARRAIKKRGVAIAYLYNAKSNGGTASKLMVVIGNERPQKREAQTAIIMM